MDKRSICTVNKEIVMKKFLFVVILFLSSKALFPAFEDFKTGARPEALGGAFTSLATDHNAVFWNPSGLSELEKPEVFSVYKRLFGIVNNFTFTSAVPSRWGNFAFTIRESSVKGNYTDVNGNIIESNAVLEAERAFIFSQGFHLIKEVSFGYNILGYQLKNIRFGDYYSLGIDIGMLMEVYKRWRIGLFYHNLNSPLIGSEYKHQLPEEVSVGLSYMPFKSVVTLLDIEKQLGYDINVKMGTELTVIKEFLIIRGGIETEPIQFSLGFGTGYRHLRLNYAFRIHTELPFTHLLEAGWEF